MPEGRQPGGATPRPRSGGAAERRYPASEVRGCDERSYPTSEVRGSGRECQAATCRNSRQELPKSEARGGGQEEQPHLPGVVAARAQEDLEGYSTFKVIRGDLLQGKEQWLRFAEAAMKRYPTSKVRETQVRR